MKHIDAVIISHEHADAILGLDDMREVQEDKRGTRVFCSLHSEDRLRHVFPYLFPKVLVPPPDSHRLDYSRRRY